MPDEAFEVGGLFHGTPEKFTVTRLEITLGESDLEGTIEVDIRDKPQVTAGFSSKNLDIKKLFPGLRDRVDTETTTQPSSDESEVELVLSVKPIDFGWLQRANGDVDITIGSLQLPVERFEDVELRARLMDGRLDITRLALVGSDGGYGSGTLVLEPVVGQGYRGEPESGPQWGPIQPPG